MSMKTKPIFKNLIRKIVPYQIIYRDDMLGLYIGGYCNR